MPEDNYNIPIDSSKVDEDDKFQLMFLPVVDNETGEEKVVQFITFDPASGDPANIQLDGQPHLSPVFDFEELKDHIKQISQ